MDFRVLLQMCCFAIQERLWLREDQRKVDLITFLIFKQFIYKENISLHLLHHSTNH